MSLNQVDLTPDTSYEFEDQNERIRVAFYVTGAVKVKDCDIVIDTDVLELHLPNDDEWIFQLFEHVYSDQSTTTEEINAAQTRTTIEISLLKQQPRTIWPQLHSYNSTPRTPQRPDPKASSSISTLPVYQLSTKKLSAVFSETSSTAQWFLALTQVSSCKVQFNETNFTLTFQTSEEKFLTEHGVSSTTPLQLLIRVKERITPTECSYNFTPAGIAIFLKKANCNSPKWLRLEANEYLEMQTPVKSSLITSGSLISTNTDTSIGPSPRYSNLSTETRQSDTYPSTLQKSVAYKLPAPSLVGFTGIYNPANSCFMNAALQCLSNTRELRDYFLQSHHLTELNRTNPLGMKGAMAEELGVMMKHLWKGDSRYVYANRLRDFAAERHQEFVGNGQHDAQELLTIVLDAIHEDLNRVLNKPQVPPVEDQNRADDIVADEYWRGYLTRNDSIVVQLFTGQFKSKTKCPQCQKESVTFDPFTSLSVPVPKRISIDTIVIHRSFEKAPRKYRILMTADGLIRDFKRLLAMKCGLPAAKMFAYRIRSHSTVEHLKDDDPASTNSYTWNSFDSIFVTEVLASSECNNEPIQHLILTQRIFKLPEYISSCAYCHAPPNPLSSPKLCTQCCRACYCNEQCQKLHVEDHRFRCRSSSTDNYEVVGVPFVISLPESKFTCKNVFDEIYTHAKRSVEIHIERTKHARRSFALSDELDGDEEEDDEDSFSDIENIDWITIKATLASADAWSICRLGDYFVRANHHTRQRLMEQQHSTTSVSNGEPMAVNDEAESSSSKEDFDMLDDIYASQPLFRLMPQIPENSQDSVQPIIEAGDESDQLLRRHSTFFVDWFTDNKHEAPLRVNSSKHRSGINDLIDDDSVINALKTDQDITLAQCLQTFIEPEVLGPDDKWFCPHCKEHIQAEKKISIWRLPPILIIHLKRFKYNQYCSSFGFQSNTREKIETTVKFPIHDLDMTPYCSSLNETNTTSTDPSQSRYDLYGLINHRGTAWSGHYTSCARLLAYNDSAKTELGWRQFDDDRVTAFGHDKDLIRPDAYVLFYRHRHLPVNLRLEEQIISTHARDQATISNL